MVYGHRTPMEKWGCVLVVGAVGLALTIWGFVMLTASGEDKRSAKVDDFSHAVEYWNAVGRAQFVGVTCSIANVTGSGAYHLHDTTAQDVLTDQYAKELPVYQPMSYMAQGTISPGLTWDSKVGRFATDLTLTCSGGGASAPSSVVLRGVELYQTQVLPLANQKQCAYQHKGAYHKGQCEVYYVAKEICLKLGLAQGLWALNATWGGAGCHWAHSWAPVTYRETPGALVSFGQGLPPRGPVDFSPLEVRVRSGLDPYVDAEELTQDSLSFGTTSGQEALFGAVLIGLGVLMLGPLGIRLYERATDARLVAASRDKARASLVQGSPSSSAEEDDFTMEVEAQSYPQSRSRGPQSSFGQ